MTSSTNNYTLIAYKSDSSDYCRGCHMASYSSDLLIESRLDEEELLQKWSQILCDNEFMLINETGYVITIMKNSYVLYTSGWSVLCDYCYNLDDEDSEEAYEADYKRITELESTAQALAKNKIKAKKEIEKQKEDEKNKKLTTEALNKRIVQYEKLKQEFGKNK